MSLGSFLRSKIRDNILNSLTLYNSYSKNMKSYCYIWYEKNQVKFKLDNESFGIQYFDDPKKMCILIRKMVGEYIFIRRGKEIKIDNCKPIIVNLILSTSFIKKLGAFNLIKFIKEWPGQSVIDDNIIVIKYNFLWNKK